MDTSASKHWDRIYAHQDPEQVTWFEPVPQRSLDLIEAAGLEPADPIIDVGGGASTLVDALLAHGHEDVSVLDLSPVGLEHARARLGVQAGNVEWIVDDVTSFVPSRRYALWHDRACFHFLLDEIDRALYAAVLHESLREGGWAIITTFAPDGPQQCSGLQTCRYEGNALLQELGPAFRLVRQTIATHRSPGGIEQRFAWMLLRKL